MAERASVFEFVQWGVESTAGTEVNADKVLEAISLTANREGNVDTFRPAGSKFPTLVTVGKEHTVAELDGILDYNCIVYPLAGLVSYSSPSQIGTLSAYTWTFTPSTSGPDTVKTYTVEKGSSVRAEQFEYGQVTGLSFSYSAKDSQITLSGNMIGNELRDGITKTSSPTTIAAVPVHPDQCEVRIATTQAGVSGATALSRLLSFEWRYEDKYGPLFVAGTDDSFVATVEQEANLGGTFVVEADSEGMAYLANVQAGDQLWLEFLATGAAIGTVNYKINFTMPIVLSALPPLSDGDGVVAAEYEFTAVHDATWGKALQITVVNAVSAL